MPPKFARLASLGAIGVCLGVAAVYALIVYISLPTPTGGVNPVTFAVTAISVAGPVLALIAVHLVVARQLVAASKDQRFVP